jgi:DNA-binding NtrC family response regulator
MIADVRVYEPPSGWEIARIGRGIDPEMPVVYISGDSAPDWASKGVPNSVMFEKPFAMPQLVLSVSQLLNDRSAGRTAAGTTE